MSVAIETTEELLTVLKKLGIKVTSVDELRSLLASINANYNPDAARTRMAKTVGVSVPCTVSIVAGVVSAILTERGSTLVGPHLVGTLAVVWGASALVSVAALIFSFALLRSRRSASGDRAPLLEPSSGATRHPTGITPDLSL